MPSRPGCGPDAGAVPGAAVGLARGSLTPVRGWGWFLRLWLHRQSCLSLRNTLILVVEPALGPPLESLSGQTLPPAPPPPPPSPPGQACNLAQEPRTELPLCLK